MRSGSAEIVPALVDDFGVTAIEERAGAVRVFFTLAQHRDAARAVLSAAGYDAQSVEVDDEDWAQRSQESLQAIAAGRITIAPPWAAVGAAEAGHPVVVIQPSMGFGTGHHATTRLCVRALQALDLANCFLLDVGTGSGVLAIVAARLGGRALGVDHDADAVAAAIENLTLNQDVQHVEFRVADLETDALPSADVVTANLTGALLIRSCDRLSTLVRPGGRLILSGLLDEERDDVLQAFGAIRGANPFPGPRNPAIVWEEHEEGWTGLGLCCN